MFIQILEMPGSFYLHELAFSQPQLLCLQLRQILRCNCQFSASCRTRLLLNSQGCSAASPSLVSLPPLPFQDLENILHMLFTHDSSSLGLLLRIYPQTSTGLLTLINFIESYIFPLKIKYAFCMQ
jgi:hypothetical protein